MRILFFSSGNKQPHSGNASMVASNHFSKLWLSLCFMSLYALGSANLRAVYIFFLFSSHTLGQLASVLICNAPRDIKSKGRFPMTSICRIKPIPGLLNISLFFHFWEHIQQSLNVWTLNVYIQCTLYMHKVELLETIIHKFLEHYPKPNILSKYILTHLFCVKEIMLSTIFLSKIQWRKCATASQGV